MTTTSDPIWHIVRQFNWLRAGAVFFRGPGERRVARFDTAEEAAADGRDRERRVRERYNPFRFGTAWHHLTTLPPPVFRDWLMDADITPPPAEEVADWRPWWEAVKGELTPARFARVWDGLNRVRFHDVIARRPAEIAYCVNRVLWDYDDSWYYAGHEGGEPLTLYRTRERAERERERLEAELRANPRERRTDWGYFPRDPERFLEFTGEADSSSVVHQDAPQYEVVEVDLPGGAA